MNPGATGVLARFTAEGVVERESLSSAPPHRVDLNHPEASAIVEHATRHNQQSSAPGVPR